jgi:CelD/BcsL family acetyltransferase involved in cellulose biosynthesis
VGLGQYAVKVEPFEGFADIWRRTRGAWHWPCAFSLPFWLENVCRHLGAPGEPHIAAVYDDQGPIGVMPLALDGPTAAFLGDAEVCDYQDFITAPGMASRVLETVIAHLGKQGVRRLDLRTLRPDAAVLDALRALGPRDDAMRLEPVDVTHETDLPDSWEGFLLQLNSKQRHEVRRKARRLENQARFTFRLYDNNGCMDRAVDAFVTLFRRNRQDKATFMSDDMAAYFRDLINILAEQQMLRLYFLDVEEQPAAAVLSFDYEGVRHLYNSGYDDKYDHLSVGILSKVFSIRSGIAMGCRRFDFLKGAEAYKKRIGGHEVPLCRCRVEL